jgi:hypothetical protein
MAELIFPFFNNPNVFSGALVPGIKYANDAGNEVSVFHLDK